MMRITWDIITLFEPTAEVFNIEASDMYSNYIALKCQ
jgi:hypothetical protein